MPFFENYAFWGFLLFRLILFKLSCAFRTFNWMNVKIWHLSFITAASFPFKRIKIFYFLLIHFFSTIFLETELVQLPIYVSPGFRVPEEEGVRCSRPQAHRDLGHLRPSPQAHHLRRGNEHQARTSRCKTSNLNCLEIRANEDLIFYLLKVLVL